MMPSVDSLCFIKLTLPSFPRLCWLDTLQICTTTSQRSLAVRLLSLGPGSSLHVAASNCPSYAMQEKKIQLQLLWILTTAKELLAFKMAKHVILSYTLQSNVTKLCSRGHWWGEPGRQELNRGFFPLLVSLGCISLLQAPETSFTLYLNILHKS